MGDKSDQLDAIIDSAGKYLETSLDLIKLKAIDKSSDVSSSVLSRIAIMVIVSIAVILFSFGLAFWIGELLGAVYLGFFVMTGVYGLIGLLFHIFRHTLLKEPISSRFIKKMLN